MDFAELLLRAFEFWRDDPSLLQHYRTRFRHVLVDEFQDTNAIQYQWLMLLAGPAGLPFVVGDDDQCLAAGTQVTMGEARSVPSSRSSPAIPCYRITAAVTCARPA